MTLKFTHGLPAKKAAQEMKSSRMGRDQQLHSSLAQ
jgi:hypothetical protein